MAAALDGYLDDVGAAVSERLGQLRDEYAAAMKTRTAKWDERLEKLEGSIEGAELALTALLNENKKLRSELAAVRASPAAAPRAERNQRASSVHAYERGESKTGLAEELISRGLEVKDLRPKGRLWVVGSERPVAPAIAKAKASGIVFSFAPNGGRATGGRPAYWTKSDA